MVFGAKSNYAVKYNDDVMNNLILGSVDIDIPDTSYSIFTPNAFNLTLSNINLPSIDCMEEPTFTQMQDNTDYFVNDFITINNKKLVVTKDFNSHIYMNDIEQGYLDEVYEDFYTIKVRGKLYSVNDPNEVISNYENLDYNYRANGIILSTDNWNLPISDVHLQSDNAQDAIKELAARGGGSVDQIDYWQRAEVIQDTITGITGDITVNENIYLSQVTLDRCANYFKYDGSDWYLGDPDEGETPTLVNLNDYGIDVSQATFDTDSSFEVYSEYLNNKSSFTVSRIITIHSVFLNGILQLKKDYIINDHTITFNDYTLKSSDSISII